MAITSTQTSVSYTGNGSNSTPYAIPFLFQEAADIFVTATTAGVTTNLVQGTDYTLTLTSSSVDFVGSIVTTAIYSSSTTIFIYRLVAGTQPSSFQSQGPLPANAIEASFDRVTMILQSLQTQIANCFRAPIGSPEVNPVAVPSTGNYVFGVMAGVIQWAQQTAFAIGAGTIVPSNMASGLYSWLFNGDVTTQVLNAGFVEATNLTGNLVGSTSGIIVQDSTAFSPASITNLYQWHKASSLGLSDGASVATWPDLSGNGRDFIAAFGHNPTYRTAVFGNQYNPYPVLYFGGNSTMATAQNLDTSLNSAYTIFVVHSSVTYNSGVNMILAANGTNWQISQDPDKLHNVVNNTFWNLDGNTVFNRINVSSFGYDGQHVSQWAYGMRVFNSLNTTVPVVSPSGMAGYPLSLGSQGGSYWYTGNVAEIIIFNRALTNRERMQVEAYLMTSYGVQSKKSIFFGDSITHGFGLNEGDSSFAGLFASYQGDAWNIARCGISGYSTTQILAGGNITDFQNSRTASEDWVFVAIGTNDKSFGLTYTQSYNNIVALHKALQKMGYKTVACTLLPNNSHADADAWRSGLNPLIVANWATFSDALSNWAANSSIGTWADRLNTTYFQADGIHPTAAGHTIIDGINESAWEAAR